MIKFILSYLIGAIPDRILEFFKDDSGALSSYRLVFITWGVMVAIVWAVTSIVKGSPQDIPGGVVTVLGLVFAGKVVQSKVENTPPTA